MKQRSYAHIKNQRLCHKAIAKDRRQKKVGKKKLSWFSQIIQTLFSNKTSIQ